jgi:hypothetical protein
MTGRVVSPFTALAFIALAFTTHPLAKGEPDRTLSKEERIEFFKAAQVWTPTTVAELDLRMGPQRKDAFMPDELVDCQFVETKPEGSSKKFHCKLADGDVVKVRYGSENGEVEGSVLASRLLWALGFGSDAAYPVRVVCHGCSDDPWTKRKAIDGTHTFDYATIERKAPGHEMKAKPEGWSWGELDLVDDTQGGAPRHQRDALKLLAVLIQHTDNKTIQQRLNCQPGGLRDDGLCTKPFLMLHDVGLTFGHANYLNRNDTASVNFKLWSETPIWRDKAACVGHLAKASTGTLGDPKISEAGRAFLAGLLDQLTEKQLHDLFEIGHVDRRSRKPGTSEPPATVDDWVHAFMQKRAEIDATRCPN